MNVKSNAGWLKARRMSLCKFFAIVLLAIVSCTASAQTTKTVKFDPVNALKDVKQYKGFTIRLVQVENNLYGYIITKGNQLVQQRTKSIIISNFTNTKASTYAVAKWDINEFIKTNRWHQIIVSQDLKKENLSSLN